MLFKKILVLAILTLAIELPAFAASLDSMYTNLTSNDCRIVRSSSASDHVVQACKGVAGYRLLLESYDLRESVTVISPDGRQHPLDFTRAITLAPSMVGEKAEWRVEKRGNQITPIALIVRVYAEENPDVPNQRTSYLSVSKITADRICVTAKIRNSTNANEQARQAAAVTADKPCLR